MTTAINHIADSVILATLLALFALPSCSWAQNANQQALEANTDTLSMTKEPTISADATDMADNALMAESKKQAEQRREIIFAEATEA